MEWWLRKRDSKGGEFTIKQRPIKTLQQSMFKGEAYGNNAVTL